MLKAPEVQSLTNILPHSLNPTTVVTKHAVHLRARFLDTPNPKSDKSESRSFTLTSHFEWWTQKNWTEKLLFKNFTLSLSIQLKWSKDKKNSTSEHKMFTLLKSTPKLIGAKLKSNFSISTPLKAISKQLFTIKQLSKRFHFEPKSRESTSRFHNVSLV